MNRTAIHDFTLRARGLLIREARELLEGVYGLDSEGGFEAAGKLPALEQLPEAAETRGRLEAFLADEAKAGLRGAEAVDKLVKEVAFTHLNRLVAFKMLEARKLIRGTLERGHDSNGFKFYLADDAHAEDLKRYEQGTLPQDALGEGPRDAAYRRFLLWQCAEQAREIKVLFDPDTLPSRLFPRPRALKQLIDGLNDSELSEAWAAGNEETIGWVYQYFIEKEKKAVFDRLYKQKKKVPRSDIPAATQIFTPRWIVTWLVQNTLGRYWVSMHPDSDLSSKLEYLVPLAGDESRPAMKPVREITLLDPACGTLHFGLVAFDLFAEMYREEMRHRGEPGWPEKPSVTAEEEIASSIPANDIFGIDIDLRAVQLSALTLFVKAKSLHPKSEIRESNLACADVLLLNGTKLDEFLTRAGLERPIYRRILKAFWDRAKDAGHAGSLQRLEKDIRELVAEEREHYEPGGEAAASLSRTRRPVRRRGGRDGFLGSARNADPTGARPVRQGAGRGRRRRTVLHRRGPERDASSRSRHPRVRHRRHEPALHDAAESQPALVRHFAAGVSANQVRPLRRFHRALRGVPAPGRAAWHDHAAVLHVHLLVRGHAAGLAEAERRRDVLSRRPAGF